MTNQRSEILAVNEAFYRAFEKKDIEAMDAVWSQGTGSLCVHPGWNVLRGWKDIRSSWVNIFKNTAYVEIDAEIITTEVRDRIAYIVLVENVLQITNGRRLQAQSIATNMFELLGERWYLVHHHASPVMR
jgi:ketosteroid isomerase-like protein